MKTKDFLELVDLLQDNTDICSRLEDVSTKETENNPEGEYAQVERWLRNEFRRNNFEITK